MTLTVVALAAVAFEWQLAGTESVSHLETRIEKRLDANEKIEIMVGNAANAEVAAREDRDVQAMDARLHAMEERSIRMPSFRSHDVVWD